PGKSRSRRRRKPVLPPSESASTEQESDPVVRLLHSLDVAPYRRYANGSYDAFIGPQAEIAGLEERVEALLPGAEVICLGQHLYLVKQVGSPSQLEKTYQVSMLTGSHGIGHTRLSTESRVDLSHSQPFWAHGVPDLATVHNGHITNYHKFR